MYSWFSISFLVHFHVLLLKIAYKNFPAWSGKFPRVISCRRPTDFERVCHTRFTHIFCHSKFEGNKNTIWTVTPLPQNTNDCLLDWKATVWNTNFPWHNNMSSIRKTIIVLLKKNNCRSLKFFESHPKIPSRQEVAAKES